MFGRKIVVCIISIIMLVLLLSSVCNATNSNFVELDGNPEEGKTIAIDKVSNDIIGRCIFPIILEIINGIAVVILALKKKIKKNKCILIVLLNVIMMFITVMFWNKNYSIWTVIIFLNIIIQIAILISIIYLLKERDFKYQEKDI